MCIQFCLCCFFACFASTSSNRNILKLSNWSLFIWNFSSWTGVLKGKKLFLVSTYKFIWITCSPPCWHILLNIFQDYVGNKRLELSGQLISLLFEVFFSLIWFLNVMFYVSNCFSFLKDLFKTMNSQAVELMNKNSDRTRSSPCWSSFDPFLMKIEGSTE